MSALPFLQSPAPPPGWWPHHYSETFLFLPPALDNLNSYPQHWIIFIPTPSIGASRSRVSSSLRHGCRPRWKNFWPEVRLDFVWKFYSVWKKITKHCPFEVMPQKSLFKCDSRTQYQLSTYFYLASAPFFYPCNTLSVITGILLFSNHPLLLQ